ncbi:hypothetical protein [Flavobacterium sp. K5-23]|uniref:hypothetical protein n=1 Tax=Flavobacterium sp. K5-23 TaxID=2746225 RepID=UPI00200CB9B8|nr:hypothetical protein [Flavobacterium sp. K5-23]UQD55950.1 hypothetical protein FLAK523_05855 [Flavobacterium sp. K5-23]
MIRSICLFCSNRIKKIMFYFLLLLFISCNKSTVEVEKGFNKIENIVSRDELIKGIVPNEKMLYWEYVRVRLGLKKGVEIRVKHCFGDSLIKKKYNIVYPKKGLIRGEFISYTFISYIDDEGVKYVTTEKELIDFVGKIDNAEEAALIMSYKSDLWIDNNDIRGGAYKKVKDGFELYMMKYYNCPVKKESFKVEIDTNGNFKYKSNGVYYKSKDCIMT